MQFTLVDGQGNKVECKAVALFKDEGNNIDYITYTDGTKNEDGQLKVYASRYCLDNGNYMLKDIEHDYEWDLIDNFLKSSQVKGSE